MSTPRPSRDVVLSEMDDGTAVLLHMRTKFYFALNSTGLFCWRQLEKGVERTELPTILASRFRVDPETARRDLEALIVELLEEELLVAE
ncbi:MAG: PqqD family protein [Deltaproteobacteria bacterium]|nr:PqqD family protein [Deltaproteobacteria bacterium]